MVDGQRLDAVLAALAASDGEQRRLAERDLEDLVVELLDHKVRHALCGCADLKRLVAVALAPHAELSPAAQVLLDRFRYRLAHVAT
ncbi:hypothetical protein KBZ20_17340 [Vulcanococcus limneticus Candia 3F8]|uniref:hypothetical protein n=1 Tax=Vulcanococcus limneticus TaxID=2170428 RepID=UPI0020CE71FB|nr:hypothetical protein [Vulcanococcus limneticus]MCP9793379.1 hypothetical protein [Vulcanococcus limneticus MW73D5]MCP9895527.1 hypothetical protein [Vulcanococcus limneticus Candia 3F8]MCP9898796.1 hypothetical protein [Vulcanococcus limneticus Candia 3B3]